MWTRNANSAQRDSDGDGLHDYATRIYSMTNTRNGLYWPTREDEPPSPLGPLVAAAAREGYPAPGPSALVPYHGYYYRMLTRQGPHAAGGGYDYYVNGKMLAGFALLAYPARHGASGVMSFLVNQDGVVFQKNLGRATAELAARMTAFDPDASWARAPQVHLEASRPSFGTSPD